MRLQTAVFGFLSLVSAGEFYRSATYAPPVDPPRGHKSQGAIPPILIQAIIDQESSGDPTATRFEPHLYERYRSKLPRNEADARMMVSSIGLMQVIPFFHLRTCKLKHYSELFNEKINRECGEAVLLACYRRYADRPNRLSSAIACYNGGRVEYANSVLSRVAVATLQSDFDNLNNSAE